MSNGTLAKVASARIIVATHYRATGPSIDLYEYLQTRAAEVVMIAHPLPPAEGRMPYFERCVGGRVVERKQLSLHHGGTSLFLFLRHFFSTFISGARLPGTYDLFVGSDNLNASVGILLKRFGKVRQTAFYTIDYVPRRFDNRWLNALYHASDRFAVRWCDRTWNLSPRMAEARARVGIPFDPLRQVVVPIGMHLNRVPHAETASTADERQIAFMGHLRAGHGIELLLRAFSQVARKLPDTVLVVVGGGPKDEELRRLARELGVAGRVRFTGFVEDHREIERILLNAAIGVAPYEPDPNNFTYFADPGKLKNYLAAGLAVLVTDVPAFAREIAQREAGKIVPFDESELAAEIINLLNNPAELSRYRSNARELARAYDWPLIFERALGEVLPELGAR